MGTSRPAFLLPHITLIVGLTGSPALAAEPLNVVASFSILGDLVTLSAAHGTKITIRNGVGYIELPARAASQ